MGIIYSSTLLAQDSSVIEIQKADLDLLKKINDIGSGMTGPYSIGNSKGSASFSENGTFVLTGDATVYNDINTAIGSGKVPAANFPTWTVFLSPISQYTFAVNDNIQLDAIELLHDWKEGSAIEIHIHWSNNGLEAVDKYVKWQISYTLANMSSSPPFNKFPVTTAVSKEAIIFANTQDRSHIYTSIATIDMTGYKVGTCLLMSLARIASTGTAPVANPFAIQVGVHYEISSLGTMTIPS